MLLISIPTTKLKIRPKEAVSRARRAVRKEKSKEITHTIYDNVYYYPYYIGKVYTSKSRLYGGDKEIDFYVVCDAIDRTYIVLRNVPKLKEVESCTGDILPVQLNEKEFTGDICPCAVKERINKQFIFGAPHNEFRYAELIYLPGYIVKIRCAANEEKRYFVNAYTGEVKSADFEKKWREDED
jgi:hypothetical protein